MPVELPVPDQQILDRHRESGDAVGSTPGSVKRLSKKAIANANVPEDSSSNPSSASQRSPRPRPKPANANLAAGVAAIELEPTAGPSSERKGKGTSKNKEVRNDTLLNTVFRLMGCPCVPFR